MLLTRSGLLRLLALEALPTLDPTTFDNSVDACATKPDWREVVEFSWLEPALDFPSAMS